MRAVQQSIAACKPEDSGGGKRGAVIQSGLAPDRSGEDY
jgi:hypothetical protein